jgi:succinate dehydrogenase / fumarate reductase, cytochrome b subunit
MSLLVTYWNSTVGKKMVMAVTGLVLFAYVFVHMLGNLQLYAGDGGKAINEYAAFLHSSRAAPLLWGARIVLSLCVILHVWAAITLTMQAWGARPIRYAKRNYREAGLAARTMILSGPAIALFVTYHILHLTVGSGGAPFTHLDAFGNVVRGFQIPWLAALYVVAVLLLGWHFKHGLWSWFQTLGWSHPAHDRCRRTLANVLAAIVVIGDLSFPIAVLAGLVALPGGAA